jgi:hypothetical protein
MMAKAAGHTIISEAEILYGFHARKREHAKCHAKADSQTLNSLAPRIYRPSGQPCRPAPPTVREDQSLNPSATITLRSTRQPHRAVWPHGRGSVSPPVRRPRPSSSRACRRTASRRDSECLRTDQQLAGEALVAEDARSLPSRSAPQTCSPEAGRQLAGVSRGLSLPRNPNSLYESGFCALPEPGGSTDPPMA